jgi:hypothetical protein
MSKDWRGGSISNFGFVLNFGIRIFCGCQAGPQARGTGMPWRDDDLEEDDDPVGEDYSHRDPHPSTILCPHCKTDIYADSERCPHCGMYLSEETDVPARKPWWIILGSLAVLAIVYMWIRSNQ